MKSFSPENYDTVIFDLGEVIVDLNGHAVIEGLKAISNKHDVNYKELIVSSPLLQRYETGKIDGEAFREGMLSLLEMELSHAQFDDIWNAMLGDIPLARLELMDGLGKNFQTMILSNTNAIHELKFDVMVGDLVPGRKMKDFVHHAYYSHDIGYRKPDPDIYRFLINKHELDPSRTIFLDDRPENIESARGEGIEAIQVKYPDQIFEILGYER